jgi:hypothetical protein
MVNEYHLQIEEHSCVSYPLSSKVIDLSAHPQGNHKRIEMSLTELTYSSSTVIIITIHPHQIKSPTCIRTWIFGKIFPPSSSCYSLCLILPYLGLTH